MPEMPLHLLLLSAEKGNDRLLPPRFLQRPPRKRGMRRDSTERLTVVFVTDPLE